MNICFYLLAFLFVLFGCTVDDQKNVSQCISCHAVHPDSNHQQNCVSCHKGDNQSSQKDIAHIGYNPYPAHPDHLAETCGTCHPEIVRQITSSTHFTLRNSTNMFRKAFGAKTELASFVETPQKSDPETALELADDLLRRRCFRCHLYSSGDSYPAVVHGTGCGACHMVFDEGKLQSHQLQSPGDKQCLSCHYGNYVGFDYYGRFEHDFNAEYRTPYTTKNKYFRPYGVEFHQLIPDVHQLRGMLCTDCHSGSELMGTGMEKPSCKGCHLQEELLKYLPPRIEARQGLFILRDHNQREHPVPLARHPSHQQYADTVTCQACHAQWTFNDSGKHFLRSDTDDFEIWAYLTVQGSFEIESILENNNDFDKTELPGQMTDKLTGEPETGLWYKGYTMRRWEDILLGRDDQGRVTTMRPVLDFYLSWIDADERIRFDSEGAQAANQGLRPYMPHTTGPAGFFHRERLERFLAKERSSALPQTISADKSDNSVSIDRKKQ
jgi:hypothetical protein